MIVDDLYILGSRCGPAKAQAPLIVNTNAVLTLSVALQGLKPIAGWRSQEIQRCCCLDLSELTCGHLDDRSEARGLSCLEELAGVVALEALDHRDMV